MSTVAKSTLWWNRRVPIVRPAMVLFITFTSAWLLWWNWDAITDLSWCVRHGNTARIAGKPIKVPWMWEPTSSTSWQSLALHRARWNKPLNVQELVVALNKEQPGYDGHLTDSTVIQGRIMARFGAAAMPEDITAGQGRFSEYKCVRLGTGVFRDFLCTSVNGAVSVRVYGTDQDYLAMREMLATLSDPRFH